MPQFNVESIKNGARLPDNALPSKADVIRLSRLLREENPEPRTYKRPKLISDIRDAVITSYQTLHPHLQGPVLFNNSKIFKKIDDLLKRATKVINNVKANDYSKNFMLESVEFFDILECR